MSSQKKPAMTTTQVSRGEYFTCMKKRTTRVAFSSAMANAIGQGTAAGHVAFADNLAAQNNPYQQLGMLQGLTQQPTAPPQKRGSIT